MSERTSVDSADGRKLAVQRWPASGDACASVLIVHGYFEHGGRYDEFGRYLAARRIEACAVDLRGHGLSSGARGHIGSFDEYLWDVDAAWARLSGEHRFLLGHSLGGLVALRWMSEPRAGHAPSHARGLILTNPFLQAALRIPAWKVAVGRVMASIYPKFSLPAGLDPSLLSHDEASNDGYRQDKLVFDRATAGWFAATTRAQAEMAHRTALPVPLLCVVGEADGIALPQATLDYFERVRAPRKTLSVLPQQYHEVLHEPQRIDLFDAIASWIDQNRSSLHLVNESVV